MISARHDHDPTFIFLVSDHLRVPKIPTAWIVLLLARIFDHNRAFLGILPGAAVIHTIGQSDALISVRAIRIKRGIIGDKAFSSGFSEQPRGIIQIGYSRARPDMSLIIPWQSDRKSLPVNQVGADCMCPGSSILMKQMVFSFIIYKSIRIACRSASRGIVIVRSILLHVIILCTC
ncbi:hypothetical protein D3C81_1138860 [compost metagenome]